MSLYTLAMMVAVVSPAPAMDAPFEAPVQALTQQSNEVGAASLAEGKRGKAIRLLEAELEKQPEDPGMLINLGIAYAQRGDDARARALFEAALTSKYSVELETADGNAIDSRRLARKALGMLARGELTTPARQAAR